ncbi:hypothetical protein [Desulfosporosinus sp. OT]|nr:hypothetical protein [Desulfosporosinus sp. OT]EGW38664.1 hypothetical protein DOT_3474 [Desulfosporosinus sp. OT]
MESDRFIKDALDDEGRPRIETEDEQILVDHKEAITAPGKDGGYCL